MPSYTRGTATVPISFSTVYNFEADYSDRYKEKLAYFNNIKIEDIKNFEFISGDDIRINNIYLSRCIDSAKGIFIILKKNSLLTEDDNSLEAFKSGLSIAYINVKFVGHLVSDTLNIMYHDDTLIRVFSNTNTSDMIEIDGVNFYIDRQSLIKITKLSINYTISENHLSDSLTKDIHMNSTMTNKEMFNHLCNNIIEARNTISSMYNAHRQASMIRNRTPNTSSKKFISNKCGDYVKHRTPFAIELECYGKDQTVVGKMSGLIASEWGVSRDGSLTSDIGYPIEIQSPILGGVLGENNVIETCKILNNLGFVTDKTCGFHVHLGCGDSFIRNENVQNGERPSNLISLYLFHRLFENVMVSFLPTTRRKNNYCGTYNNGVEHNGATHFLGSLDEAFSTASTRLNSLRDFEMYWYKAKNGDHVYDLKNRRYTVSRYMGINFHSLLKDNHIEVRYHSGTLNYEKILYWINLQGRIVELCASGVINQKMLIEIKNKKLSLEKMTEKLFELLTLDVDTVEYLLNRQEQFKNADTESIDEIAIDKTKTLSII